MRWVGASSRAALGVALLCALTASACGYTLVDYSAPPPGLETVAIQVFENDSFESGVELVFTDALRREFLRRGAVRLVDDRKAADLVISGAIPEVRTRSRSFSTVALALEWEVTVSLRVQARLRSGSEIPFDQDSMTGTERYLASADLEATRKNRDEAMRKIAAVLATRVHDILYEARQ